MRCVVPNSMRWAKGLDEPTYAVTLVLSCRLGRCDFLRDVDTLIESLRCPESTGTFVLASSATGCPASFRALRIAPFCLRCSNVQGRSSTLHADEFKLKVPLLFSPSLRQYFLPSAADLENATQFHGCAMLRKQPVKRG
jgi:hypothetical protein